MKTMRKLVGTLLVLAMIFSLSAVVFAGGQTLGFKITNATDGNTYEAYQIFSAKLYETLKPVEGQTGAYELDESILSDIEWGSGVTDLTKSVVNHWYVENIDNGNGVPSAKEIAATITDTYAAAAFADRIANTLNESAAITAVAQNGVCEISVSDAGPGYYLIRNKTGDLNGKYDTATDDILLVPVIDEYVNVELKKDEAPVTQKWVAEISQTVGNAEWNDYYVNAAFEDTVWFRLDASFPANYMNEGGWPVNFEGYNSYFFEFRDKIPAGIDINENTVQVYTNHYYDQAIDSEYYNVGISKSEDGTTQLVVTFEDLTQTPYNWNREGSVDHAVFASLHVVYQAKLNTKAVIGFEGNRNVMHAVFQNDPDDLTSLGQTPDDDARVCTFGVILNKVNENGDPLAEATFVLMKGYENEEDPEEYYVFDENGVIVSSAASLDDATPFTTGADGKIEIMGLDSGYYRFVEISAPDGYNKLDDAVGFYLGGTGTGINEIEVVNERGLTLPSTGGMGTTLFYIVGIVMVLGAGVVVFARRRASDIA